MADRRLFNQSVLMSTEFLFELGSGAKNLYLAIGLNTDTYGFTNNYERLMEETRTNVDDMQELINHKFVYLIDKINLLDLKFQINNMIAPTQHSEPRYPQGLKYIYMDIDCQYHWSSKQVRKVVGYDKKGKDNLTRKDFFIDAEKTQDKNIVEFDTTQQLASEFLEPQQAPSNPAQYTVSTPAKEVAPKREVAPAPVQSNFDIKSKIANAESIEQEEATPVQPELTANPYADTEQGQQEVEQLRKKYGVANQTRSMPELPEEEEDTSLPFGDDEDTQAGLPREEQNTQPIDYSPADTSDLPFPD